MVKSERHEMRTISTLGDIKVSWDKNNKDEIETAKNLFNEKISKGWTAFADKHGTKGNKITEFDSDSEKIILVPPFSGGMFTDYDY